MRILLAGWLTLQALWLSAQPIPSWIEGHWSGTGYQTDIVIEWRYLVSWYPGQEHIRVEYPSLQCEGYWVYRKEYAGRMVFQEMVTRNSGQCAQQDWIYLSRLGPDAIWLEFAHADSPKQIIARALLRRRSLP